MNKNKLLVAILAFLCDAPTVFCEIVSVMNYQDYYMEQVFNQSIFNRTGWLTDCNSNLCFVARRATNVVLGRMLCMFIHCDERTPMFTRFSLAAKY